MIYLNSIFTFPQDIQDGSVRLIYNNICPKRWKGLIRCYNRRGWKTKNCARKREGFERCIVESTQVQNWFRYEVELLEEISLIPIVRQGIRIRFHRVSTQVWSGIIPAGFIPGFLTPDNNLTNKRNLIKFGYIVELITLFRVKKNLVWSLR